MRSGENLSVGEESNTFREAVAAQLNRVFASQFFRSSPRHQTLLRTIVKESLEDRTEALKEIVLAKEVFGRPDYDPRHDTLVRVEVNAVRRKLAEYYQQAGAQDGIYIEIPRGHYVAVFSPLAAKPEEHAQASKDTRRTRYTFAVVVFILFAVIVLFRTQRSRTTAPGVPVQVTFDTGWTAQPAVTRDGSVLVYSSDRGPHGNSDIWVQQAGKPPRQLTDDPAHDIWPDISPDGKRVVFRSWRKEEGIWSISAEGGKPKLLAKGGYSPRFSPNGKWIAFTGMATDEIGHVFTIPASGGALEQLDSGTADAQCPVWSPDGSEAVFSARDVSGRNYDLWIAKFTGARNELSRPLGIEAQLRARNLPAESMCPQDWLEGRLLFGARRRDTSFLFETALGASGTAGQILVVPSAIGVTGARMVRESVGG